MSKGGIWGRGVLLSAVLKGWERTVRVYQRFAVRVVDQSRTIRQENSVAVARPTNDFKTVQIDLRWGIAEFEEFTKAMRIGDRIRAFCNDGVIEAEKVSQTRFKLIYSVETTGPIH
jgi:hypothetical protein